MGEPKSAVKPAKATPETEAARLIPFLLVLTAAQLQSDCCCRGESAVSFGEASVFKSPALPVPMVWQPKGYSETPQSGPPSQQFNSLIAQQTNQLPKFHNMSVQEMLLSRPCSSTSTRANTLQLTVVFFGNRQTICTLHIPPSSNKAEFQQVPTYCGDLETSSLKLTAHLVLIVNHLFTACTKPSLPTFF